MDGPWKRGTYATTFSLEDRKSLEMVSSMDLGIFSPIPWQIFPILIIILN